MIFVLILTYLISMTISKSIHVAANGIILFFLMANIPLYICTTSKSTIKMTISVW